MKLRNLLLMISLAVAAMPARAIVPETGLYWMPDFSGTAVYVEHQNGTVVVTIYAFDPETGQAEIYTSAGPLRDDGGWVLQPQPDPPFGNIEGYLPSNWYRGDLYQATHGQPLTGLQFGYSAQSEKVGTITLGFVDANNIQYVVQRDDPPDRFSWPLRRFDFSQGSYIASSFATFPIMIDALGEWVFVDVSDPMAPPLRFDFSQRDPADPPGQVPSEANFAVTYRDPSRDARLVCAKHPEGDSGDPEQPQKADGCELYVGEGLILSARLGDVGLDRIQAFRGALPPAGRNPYRRPETVIGMRVRHADVEPVATLPIIAD